jgi:hypothetical protein
MNFLRQLREGLVEWAISVFIFCTLMLAFGAMVLIVIRILTF